MEPFYFLNMVQKMGKLHSHFGCIVGRNVQDRTSFGIIWTSSQIGYFKVNIGVSFVIFQINIYIGVTFDNSLSARLRAICMDAWGIVMFAMI